MPTSTRPAADSTPEQLRFHAIPGFTVRAGFSGGDLPSDFNAIVLVEQFVAGYSRAPANITLDLDHTDDATHDQQELAFYNHLVLKAEGWPHTMGGQPGIINVTWSRR